MSTDHKDQHCQIHDLPEVARETGPVTSLFRYVFLRVPHALKRRFTFLKRKLRPAVADPEAAGGEVPEFEPGQTVRVKERRAIETTLDAWGRLRGCGFMPEMWRYCGTEQTVFKKVEQFLDERDYKMKKCRNIYLLENSICNGTEGFGRCDRSCFYFWRAEWLEHAKDR